MNLYLNYNFDVEIRLIYVDYILSFSFAASLLLDIFLYLAKKFS